LHLTGGVMVTTGYARLPRARHVAPSLPGRLAGGLAIAGIAIILFAVAIETVLPTTAVIWSSLALAVYCTGLLCITAAATGRDGLGIASWKIGQWSLAWCAITSGLATLTWRQPQHGIASQIAITSILRALWLVALAMTAWALGYCGGSRRLAVQQVARLTTALARRYDNEVRSAAVPWILLGTGIAARLVSTAATGRFGYAGDPESAVTSASGYGQILGIFSLGVPLAVAVAALRAFSPVTRGSRLTVVVMLAADIAIGAVAGGKQSFIVAVLAVAIPYAGARRRIPKGWMAAAVIFFLVVVIPFNHGYRGIARHGSVSIPAAQATGRSSDGRKAGRPSRRRGPVCLAQRLPRRGAAMGRVARCASARVRAVAFAGPGGPRVGADGRALPHR